MEIQKALFELQDTKYKNFNSKLCPDTKLKMLGIRIPKLRNLAKEILKEYSLEEAVNTIGTEYFEEVILKGMVIGYKKDIFENKKKYIQNFIPEIDSWAISDTFVPSIKPKKEELEDVYNFILPYLNSDKEFEVRVGIIFLLDYFIIDDYVEKVIKLIDNIKHDGYYVKMAASWTLAEIGIKFNEKFMNYFTGNQNHLDKFTYNKTIQKMLESRRIDKKQKEILRKMKI